MSRQALIVGEAANEESGLEQILQRYGYTRIARPPTIAEALDFMAQHHADLLFLPIAAKIRHHAHRRSESTNLVVEGLVGIVEGMNPQSYG